MTLQLTDTATEAGVRWMSPASGLWVATRAGEHAGMVERLDGAYGARDARGRTLGSFDDLDSAREAIDGAGTPRSEIRHLTGLMIAVNGGVAAIALALGYAIFLR
jgi:hypothetical protein